MNFLKFGQENLSNIFSGGVTEESITKLEETLKKNNVPQATIDSITKSLKESNPLQNLNQNTDQNKTEQAPQVPNVQDLDTTKQDLTPGKPMKPLDKLGTIKVNADDFLDDIFEEEVEECLNNGYPVDVAKKSALDRLGFIQRYLAVWAEPAPTEPVVLPGLAESAKEEEEKKKKKKKK